MVNLPFTEGNHVNWHLTKWKWNMLPSGKLTYTSSYWKWSMGWWYRMTHLRTEEWTPTGFSKTGWTRQSHSDAIHEWWWSGLSQWKDLGIPNCVLKGQKLRINRTGNRQMVDINSYSLEINTWTLGWSMEDGQQNIILYSYLKVHIIRWFWHPWW